MVETRSILFGILSLLFIVNVCSASVEFTIPQGTQYVKAGGTVNYDLDVSLGQDPDQTVPYPITEEFSLDHQIPGWIYSFNKASVDLDLSNPTDSSVLSITVPSDAVPGTYSHTVYATGYDSLGRQYNFATEVAFFVINTNVSVPEFPSVAVPVATILGMIVIFRRGKS